MRTPSLRRRVIASGVAVVGLLLLVVGTFVYLTLRGQLEDTLADVLEARVELARELGALYGPHELAAQLQARGIAATVFGPDGEVEQSEPATSRFQQGPPGPLANVLEPRVSQRVEVAEGTVVEVFATRAGVEATLRRLLILLALASGVALAVAVLLFRRAAAFSIAPLDQIVAVADRTASGQTGARLEPEDPDTELGRMAVAYDRMLDSLEDALSSTRDAEERTRRFVDDAAHQLRTPLTTIRGSAEALLQEPDPHIRDRLMANLIRETARSNRLLTSLLTLARADRWQSHDLVPSDLGELCLDEIERARSLAPELTITFEPSHEVDGTWLLDDRGTREILANLLDNARRHARQQIAVDTRLRPTPDGSSSIELRVRDDGSGVAPGASEEVFERFAALDGQGGSGLGLPIARAIARAQGGDVSHHDGAFVVRLPARAVTDPDRP